MMRSKALVVWTLIAALALLMVAGSPTLAKTASKYNFVFLCHGGEENIFWATVYKGFKDALEKYGCTGIMYRPPKEGDLEFQLSTFKAVLAQEPDGIITTIPHPTMFDDVVKQAINKGIPVIVSNTDDPEGAKGNARLSYIGQRLEDAGYNLARSAIKYFPSGPPKPLNVLIGIEGPGLVWAELRSKGITKFLDEYGAKYERLDISMDRSTQHSRFMGYLKKHPEVNMILTVGTGSAGARLAVESLGYKPGRVVIGGFDLIPEILDGIEAGYIHLTVDQQPYLQGYLPVMQLYLMKTYGLSAWDVDTGLAIVDKDDVKTVRELSEKRIR